MKPFAVVLLLLGLGLVAWSLRGTPAHDDAPPLEAEPPEAEPSMPKLTPAARQEPPSPSAHPAQEPAAGNRGPEDAGRTRYMFEVRGPDGPLAGAEVIVFRGTAMEVLPPTDETGRVAAVLAPLDDAELAVRKHGYRTESWPLDHVEQGDVAGSVHVLLEPKRGVPIRGRVVDARTKAPIEGARGTVSDWGPNVMPLEPTDAGGWFTHPGVMDDHEARITMRAPGYVTAEVSVYADSGQLRPAVPIVEMAPGGRLTGRVTAPDGKPVAGATMRVRVVALLGDADEMPPLDEENRAHLTKRYRYEDAILQDRERGIAVGSASDGTFIADGLALGVSYKARASARGFAASAEAGPLPIDASSPAPTVTLALREAGRLRVHLVLGAGGDAIEGRPRVRLFHGRGLLTPATGAGAGPYVFEDLAPGRYHVWAEAEGLLPALEDVVLGEGVDHAIDLRLDSGVEIEGVVLDQEGRPVPGLEVQAASAADNPDPTDRWLVQSRRTTSGGDGRFRVAGLLATDSVLVASGYIKGRGWVATREALRVLAPARGVRIIVKPMGMVRMRLVKPDGAPWSGELWTMTWFGSGGSGGSVEITDGDHEEVMLEDGEHHLVLAPAGYAWFHRTVKIQDGNMHDWGEIVLDPGVTVAGLVVDNDGKPLEGATITCELWDHRATQPDAEGRYALDRFPRETLEFLVEADGFVDQKRTLAAGQHNPRIVLHRPATIHGTLASEGDSAPRDTWIELRPAGTQRTEYRAPGPDGTMRDFWYWEGAEELAVDEQGRLSGQIAPGTYDAYWYPEEGEAVFLGRFSFTDGENRGIRMVIPAK